MRKFSAERLSGSSTDTRWGMFATSFSCSWAFFAFAFSFYAINGGWIMSEWLIVAFIFGGLGIISFIFSMVYGIYCLTHPLQNPTQGRLSNIQKSISELDNKLDALINEVKRDRNERNKKSE